MRILGCMLLMTIAAVAGCGDKNKKQAAASSLPSITGTVTLDTRPLEGATVSFAPVGDVAAGGIGTTNASGEFQVHLSNGNYKVVISRWLMPDGSPIPAGTLPANSGGLESLPPTYSDQNLTILKATVSSGNEKLNFDLTSGR